MEYIYPSQEKIIAIGDLHGDLDALLLILTKTNLVQDNSDNPIWIGENTFLVLIGDTAHSCRRKCGLNSQSFTRGDYVLLDYLEKLRLSIKQAKKGKLIILLGNHELMDVAGNFENYVSHNDLVEIPQDNKLGITKEELELMKQNPYKFRKNMFKPGGKLAIHLACTRVSAVIIGDYIFVHGGIVEPGILFDITKFKELNLSLSKFLLGEFIGGSTIGNPTDMLKNLMNDNSIFWNRTLGMLDKNLTLDHPFCSEYMSNLFKSFKVNNIVIGHTPNVDGISKTCNGIWRIDGALSEGFLTKNNIKQCIEISNNIARILSFKKNN